MGIIEETAVKAKDAFDVVAKKTNEVLSVQKTKFTVASIKSQLSKDFETLGRLYFDMLSDDAEMSEEVKAIKEAIDEKSSQIEQLEAEIDEQKKVTVCPTCGAKLSADAIFCSKCGEKL